MENTALLKRFVSLSEYATGTKADFSAAIMERVTLTDSFNNESSDSYNFQVVVGNQSINTLPESPATIKCAGRSNCTKCGLCGIRRKI